MLALHIIMAALAFAVTGATVIVGALHIGAERADAITHRDD